MSEKDPQIEDSAETVEGTTAAIVGQPVNGENAEDADRVDLRRKLLRKLQGGDRHYAHLNATIGRSKQKLDLESINLINDGLAIEFLNKLLEQPSFQHNISVKDINDTILKYTNEKKDRKSNKQQIEVGEEDAEQDAVLADDNRVKDLAELKKKLEFFAGFQHEEFNEYGTKSFAFGYPLLIKQVGAERDDIICAPLFLWYLEIERDYRGDRYTFARNAEANPIMFNEMLDLFLGSEEQIDLSDFTAEIEDKVTEDGFLSAAELDDALRKVTGKLSSSLRFDRPSSELTAAPSDKKAAAKLLQDNSDSVIEVVNAGVFGIFRAGKQSIINDLKNLIQLGDEDSEQGSEGGVEHVYTAIPVDPTQNEVIQHLKYTDSIIIQGPPGTGKSQTLTALITNSLANKRRTLVVCEKRTAMEIISENLDKAGLGQYVAVIDSTTRDRTAIVNRAREINDNKNINYGVFAVDTEFNGTASMYEQAAEAITAHHKSIASTEERQLGDNKRILGTYLHNKKSVDEANLLACQDRFTTIPFEFNHAEYASLLDDLRNSAPAYRKAPSILGRIPSGEVTSSNNYSVDKQNLVVKFKALLNSLTTIQKEFESEQASKIDDLVEKVSAEHKQMQAIADRALALLEVDSTEFNWPELTSDVKKLKVSGSRPEQKIIDAVAELEAQQSVLDSFRQEVRDTVEDRISKARSYKQHLDSATAATDALGDLGVRDFALTMKERAGAVFNNQQKQVKRYKLELQSALNRLNAGKAALRGLVAKHLVAIDGDVHAQLKAEYAELPRLQQIRDLVDKLPAKSFASATITPIDDKELAVGDYVGFVEVQQFGSYRELKKVLWPLFAQELAGLHVGYLSRVPFSSHVESSQQALEQLQVIRDGELSNDSLREYAKGKVAQASDTGPVKAQKEKLLAALREAPFKIFETDIELIEAISSVEDLTNATMVKVQWVEDLIAALESEDFYAFYRWSAEYQRMQPLTRALIDLFDSAAMAPGLWPGMFATLYFESLFNRASATEILSNDMMIDRLVSNDRKIKSLLIKSINQKWATERRQRIGALEAGALQFTSLYNKRGSNGLRRNSLRKIIARDFKLFTSLFPVVICNPSSATALFKLEKNLFDVVLFDEASQLRLEDTYTSLYRGKTKIVSGDEHQMPPSNYFQAALEEDDQTYESDEDIQAVESAWSESLLDFARINSYRRTMLGVHYRSEHQDLIEFSNHAFYEGRLMPIPQHEDYVPIEFHEVNGEYDERTNKDEAKFILTWLKEFIDQHWTKSVGIVTLNLPQTELLKNLIARERTIDTDFNTAMLTLEERGFFVKNLENVQGDERDIIVLSTTFGLDKEGKFKQNFGPLSQRQSYRLLNVLVTRAKHKFIVVTSVPADKYSRYEEEIAVGGKDGRAIFYAYLAYAHAVANGDIATKAHILLALDDNSARSTTDLGGELTESPFEEEVLATLESGVDKDRIKLQYEIGSRKFRIDMVILNKAKTRPMLAIECDGYAYHANPQAHLYDMYRQQILERKGFMFYRIWSTNWFHDQANESRKLLQKIHDMDTASEKATVE